MEFSDKKEVEARDESLAEQFKNGQAALETMQARQSGGILAGWPTPVNASRSPENIVEELFTYHRPTVEQQEALVLIREYAQGFAQLMLRNVPPGADRAAAIRKLRECVMTANAAIVLNGLSL